MKRSLDFIFAVVLSVLLALPFLFIALLIRLTSKGPAIHWSKRVGRNNKIFLMPKFRSMRTDAPQVATHLMTQADQFITPIGSVLRKTSLDELPQLYSVLVGEMSFIGPRPALFNQDELVALRTKAGVHHLRPGITGWAQVNGRDEIPIPVKVNYDREYLEKQSWLFDLKILFKTVFKVVKADGVKH